MHTTADRAFRSVRIATDPTREVRPGPAPRRCLAAHGSGAGVFRDRTDGGRRLGQLVGAEVDAEAVAVSVTAGGRAVAQPLASELAIPLAAAPVATLTPPWNGEPAYGAVAFDGSVRLDDDLVVDLGIARRQIEQAVTGARHELIEIPDLPDLARRTAVLVDDGEAPAIALLATIAALRNRAAARVFVALAAASHRRVQRLADDADRAFCASLHPTSRFAAAAAYAS